MSDTTTRTDRLIAPQAGPQMMLATSDADIVIFGGAAGGGKSRGLLYEAAKWCCVPGVKRYRALILRRTTGELVGGGGLWDEAMSFYGDLGGRPRAGNNLDWTFEADSRVTRDRNRVEFSHMEQESDKLKHQGKQYNFVGFDELTHFTTTQFWYLFGRLRSTNGVPKRLRATCNPDPESWVFELVGWWIDDDGWAIPERSGVLRWMIRDPKSGEIVWFDSKEAAATEAPPGVKPISLTFINSRLTDNKILLESDPEYLSRVAIQGGAVAAAHAGLGVAGFADGIDRGGNWKRQGEGGWLFRREKVVDADDPPSAVVFTVRAWDKAASAPTTYNPDPDWTRGVRVSLCVGGEIWIDDIQSFRLAYAELAEQMRAVATVDGPTVRQCLWQDSAGAGKISVDSMKVHAFAGMPVVVVPSGSPTTSTLRTPSGAKASANKIAWAESIAPSINGSTVSMKPKIPFSSDLLRELHEFPFAKHDDIVDALALGIHTLTKVLEKPMTSAGFRVERQSSARRMSRAI